MKKSLLILSLLLITTLASIAQNYDVRKVRWGMKRSEVMGAETEKLTYDSPDSLLYSGVELGRFRGTILYSFQNHQLSSVGFYLKRQSLAEQGTILEDYEVLYETLAAKYGKPKERKQANKFSYFGNARWELERTDIVSECKVTSDGYRITLFYYSKTGVKPTPFNPGDF